MLIDLHADTPLWQHWLGYDFCRGHRPSLPFGAWMWNVDLPRMHHVDMDAQVFGLVALPFEHDGFATVLRMIDRLEEAQQRSEGRFKLARSGSAILAARRAGARVGVLSLEGVHSLRGDLNRADWLIDRGVVSFGLAHFHRNAACTPAFAWGRGRDAGLTTFGRNLVQHLAARRVIVDLTHINRRGFFDALDMLDGLHSDRSGAQRRVMVSHTGVIGGYSHWRNIDDAQIRAVAERGGIVGIMFSQHFLGGGDMSAVVRHIMHVLRIGGWQCAALGSDFDGFIVPVRGLRDISGLPALREALRRAGLNARDVDAVMGDNAMTFLRDSLG